MNLKKYYLILFFILTTPIYISAEIIRGKVLDEFGSPLPSATVSIKEINKGMFTDENGIFRFSSLPSGEYTLEASFIGFSTYSQRIVIQEGKTIFLEIDLKPNTILQDVEVFGERYKQPEKLDAITRMPLRPSEQIQSISVISEKLIAEQGALTITDVVRNVPGVTLFGSYGGVRESLSTRGYRGVPILKNGVRVDSDFRTASLASDMQGVESVQVLKGSAAITQGIGNDLGSPGGVINVVTKTPKFVNGGEVGLRIGSWGQVRPTFDVQSVLDKNRTVAFRLNGAYERADGFKRITPSNSVYINPSLEWRPDAKTTVTLEMDYYDSDKTPDVGTVNLAGDSIDALYEGARFKYFGFDTDNVNNKTTTYAARITRQLADKISLRAAYFASSYQLDNINSNINSLETKDVDYNRRKRTLNRNLRDDKNSTFQLDLIGRDVYTGSIKHTFQIGFDYKKNNLVETSYNSLLIDTLSVFNSAINNTLPTHAKSLNIKEPSTSTSSNYGIMLQEVMTINDYIKAILGVRYSAGSSTKNNSSGKTSDDAWNPMAGIMITPVKNLNLFGSYTTTTSLRSAANKMENGEDIGASMTKQWETGFKSDWLNDRLRFNFTYFDIITDNLSNRALKPNSLEYEDFYFKAGDLKRKGVETELSGSLSNNLQVMLGYAYLDAKYENSPSYVNGSAPMNAPKHTANAWIQYQFTERALKGLSLALGAYYVGERPVNEYSTDPDLSHGRIAGVKPFDMPAYTTVNAQIGYTIGKVTARVFINNILDEIGYNSYYRGGYINFIDPRNFAGVVTYKF